MVQRKVPNKLGIHTDHVNSSNRLLGTLKSSSQNQEGKNRPDLKKKKTMKKSRSFKVSDKESLKLSSSSSSLKRHLSQPGQPPPVDVTVTPCRQFPIKTTEGSSPNYMKSTSSSHARRECKNARTCSDGKKSVKSLKKVRTLTKTTSFKTVRASVKKYSDVVLCDDINAQRATCSSTLKDSKFPAYLMLNPGGTESDGTSAMKVCPYNYCSLNGHHHAPLAPLKCFLKAKRRSINTQKSIKVEGLSPRRATKSNEDKAPNKEGEDGMNFFIKICTENTTQWDNEAMFDIIQGQNDSVVLGAGFEEMEEYEDVKKVAERTSDGLPESEIDDEEKFEEYSDGSTERDETENHLGEEDKLEAADEEYPFSLSEVDATMGSFCCRIDFEGESQGSIDDDMGSDTSTMEWEEQFFSSSGLHNEVGSSNEGCCESDYESEYFSGTKNDELHDIPMTKTDEINANCYEEILADEVIEYLETQPNNGDPYSEGSVKEVAILKESGEQTNIEFVSIVKEPILEPTVATREVQRNSRSLDAEKTLDESMNNYQETYYLEDEDDTTAWQLNQASDASKDFTKTDQMETTEQTNGFQKVEETNAERSEVISDFGLEQDPPTADLCKDEELIINSVTSQDQSCMRKGQGEMESEQDDTSAEGFALDEDCNELVDNMELEEKQDEDAGEAFTTDSQKLKRKFFPSGGSPSLELSDTCNGIKWEIRYKKPIGNCEEEREFNLREPNYLPVVVEPEAEKVDLRHQMMDARKSSEEWMLDFALRQAVTKLAPERKKKVALLVEAFETVTPVSRYGTRGKHTADAFVQTIPVQACR